MFLGYNPLRASFQLKLKAAYANNDSLKIIEQKLLLNSAIMEVSYQKTLVNEVNQNVKKISLFLLVFTGLLGIISLALINHSIRLYIYSKRFIIRTMQLVGATQSFISKPFIKRSILNGFYSSLITIVMLMGLIYAAEKSVPELIELQDINLFIQLFALVIVAGILITAISTYFAVKKYLKIETNELYN
jgi:cell division transport system permease protein